jgi:hypothetical protein
METKHIEYLAFLSSSTVSQFRYNTLNAATTTSMHTLPTDYTLTILPLDGT